MLHILRHSSCSDSRLDNCLRSLSPQQSLLLIEEAVYNLLPHTASRSALDRLPSSINVYTLQSHLLARGLTLDMLQPRVKAIDYSLMVELCITHTKVMSW